MKLQSQPSHRTNRFRRRMATVAIASLLAGAGSAYGFEIETDNPDIQMRWDNTFRYNLGFRVQSQKDAILGSPNYDDGDRNFGNGTNVTNRLDILSEFDFIFQKKYGFRVSAAAWGDAAYPGGSNTSPQTSNTLVNGLPVAGALSPTTKSLNQGISGEILDAFGFANFDVADMPVNVKAGQHTVYWGEGLYIGGVVHGITYAQNSIDASKAFATPGTEAKELFRPRGGITLQVQPVKELSLAGQWFYGWEPIRYPESGSYLAGIDYVLRGADSLIVAKNPFAAVIPGAPTFLRAWRGYDIQPPSWSSSLGDYGVQAKWSPSWLDGTLGFYYRNATDIQPQAMVTPGLATGVPAALCNTIGGQPLPGNACIINRNATTVADLQKYGKYGLYNAAYGDNIHIYGVSLSKEIAGVSVGAEFSYRQNMPLASDPIFVVPAPLVPTVPGSIATTAVPTRGTPGALGDTYHGLLNGIWIVPKTGLFDTATLQGELTWMEWSKVTQNEAVFKGRDSYNKIDKPSKNYFGLAATFTPTWFQVFPGMDLSAPLTWNQGISGNSAVTSGGNKNAGSWSAGVALDVYQKYKATLAYNGYFGKYSTNASAITSAGQMDTPNGTNAALSDRGWISLTLKATF
jgi:hypothetical protein